MSNTFAVTTPYADGAGAGYFETYGALEFSPNSVADPNAPTINLQLAQRLQQRRQTFDTLPQTKKVAPRGVRSASARPSAGESGGPARPGVQSMQPSKNRPQHQSDNHQIVRADYDEMLGVRDDSDPEARMQRLLNQLEFTGLDNRKLHHEGGWASSPSLGYRRGPPPSYENGQRPSALTRGAFARQLEDSTTPRYPAPSYDNERVLPQDSGGMDSYTEAGSRFSAFGQIPQFPNPPENTTARSPLPRYKSAPSIPSTIAISPPPPRSPLRSATAGTEANYAPGRKPNLFRDRHGGSEQSLQDLSRQTSRPAQLGQGYGQHSNPGGNLFLSPLVTPTSPSTVPPSLISDSMSRSSSFGSTQTRLVTPTDSIAPVHVHSGGAPHALGRIDEKFSLDYKHEIEAAKHHRDAVLFKSPSHTSSELQERREGVMEKTPGVRLANLLPSSGWQPPTPGGHSSGKYARSVATTPATSFFDTGSITGGSSIGGGHGGHGGHGGGGGLSGSGSLQRSYSRSGGSEISSFNDTVSRTSGGMTNSTKERGSSPTVLAATSFANSGTMPTGAALSKAEKAAEKARQKAERAAKKAEAALFKVELERESRAQTEESKRAAAEIKKEAKKREKEERQKQADLTMTRLVLFST